MKKLTKKDRVGPTGIPKTHRESKVEIKPKLGKPPRPKKISGLSEAPAAGLLNRENPKIRLLYFSAPWCEPCQDLKAEGLPERLCTTLGIGLKVVDEIKDHKMTEEYEVMTWPTFLLEVEGVGMVGDEIDFPGEDEVARITAMVRTVRLMLKNGRGISAFSRSPVSIERMNRWP